MLLVRLQRVLSRNPQAGGKHLAINDLKIVAAIDLTSLTRTGLRPLLRGVV